MNTTVRGAKVRKWGIDIRSITGGSSKPTDQVAPLKKKLLRIDEAIKALPGSTAPSAAGTALALRQSHTDIGRRLGLLSPASDKSILAPYEQEIRKLETDATQAASFVLEYDKAIDRERSLLVLNRPGEDFAAPVRTLMNGADGLAANGKFGEAVTQLKLTETLTKNQIKAAKEKSEVALDDAHLKPLYDNKVVRIQRAIDELEPLPGTAAARKKLEGLLTAGKQLAKPGNYKKAYDALAGLSGTLKEGRKAAKEFNDKVGDPAFRDLLTQTQSQLKTYAGLLPLTTPEVATDLEGRLNRLLLQQDTTPPPTDFTAAKQSLGVIAEEIKKGSRELQEHANAWKMLFPEVDTKMGLVRDSATTGIYEGVLASFRACTTQHGLRNDKDAVVELRKLNLRCNDILLVHEPVRRRWTELSKTVDTDHLPTLQKTAEYVLPELSKVAGPLLSAYATARETVPNTHDYAAAVEAAEKVVDQVPRLVEPMLLKYESLQDKRVSFREQVDTARNALQLQIDALAKAGGDTTTAAKALDQGVAAWTAARNTALDETALDLGLQQALKILGDAAGAVRLLLASPQQLAQSKDAKLALERQSALDQATQAVNGPLKRLLEEYPGDAKNFVDLRDELLRLAAAETTASRPVMKQQVDQMNTLASQVREQLDKRLQEATVVADKTRKAAKLAIERIAALKKNHGDFVNFFKEVEAEVQDAAAMAESTVHKLVAAGLAQLSAGGAVFDRLTALETSDDFARVDWFFGDLDDMFDGEALKTCKPVLLKTLKKRLKEEVKPSAYSQSPVKAIEVLAAFRQEVMQAQTDAEQAQAARLEIAKLKSEAKQALAGLAKSDAPKVWAMLSARIEAAGKVVEGREYDSKSQLLALKVTLGRLTGGDPAAANQLVEMERQIETREFNDKKAKAQWEAKVDLFDKNEAREAETARDETPAGNRDVARYAEIGRLRKEAAKLAGKGQYTEALQRLTGAINEARDFIANPFNAATTARKDLVQAGSKWASAVSTFVGKLNDLGDAIEKQSAADLLADPSADVGPYTAAVKAVDELKSTFNPEHFTGAIEALSREGLNLTQVRTAKEAALRLLRGCRDTLASDPMLQQVAVNPFGAPVPLKPLADRLNDLDLNFQRF